MTDLTEGKYENWATKDLEVQLDEVQAELDKLAPKHFAGGITHYPAGYEAKRAERDLITRELRRRERLADETRDRKTLVWSVVGGIAAVVGAAAAIIGAIAALIVLLAPSA